MLFGGVIMFVSFGHRLRGLGNMRVGFRMKGSTGCFFACLYACMNALIYLCWYAMLAVFWLMYGTCYVSFYLPIKGIIKLYKKTKRTSNTSEDDPGPLKFE